LTNPFQPAVKWLRKHWLRECAVVPPPPSNVNINGNINRPNLNWRLNKKKTKTTTSSAASSSSSKLSVTASGKLLMTPLPAQMEMNSFPQQVVSGSRYGNDAKKERPRRSKYDYENPKTSKQPYEKPYAYESNKTYDYSNLGERSNMLIVGGNGNAFVPQQEFFPGAQFHQTQFQQTPSVFSPQGQIIWRLPGGLPGAVSGVPLPAPHLSFLPLRPMQDQVAPHIWQRSPIPFLSLNTAVMDHQGHPSVEGQHIWQTPSQQVPFMFGSAMPNQKNFPEAK